MPLEGFYCPDNERVTVRDCMSKCRMGERCLTQATLYRMSREREWTGKASTTQLINGTMLEFLSLTCPYYVDPDSRAFMLQGSRHHRALEEAARELGLPAEIALSVDRDIFDLMEFEDNMLVLTDYKLWGSFKVAKAKGFVEVGKQPDPSGAVYKSSGKWGKAGSPKMVPVFKEDPEQADNFEAELQLSRYSYMLEDLGLMPPKLQVQATVRDGGLAIAFNRGVFKNTYKIPVKKLDREQVDDYFSYKDSCLQQAMAQGEWDIPCDERESWEGRRCLAYCDVAEFCPKGKLIKKIGGRNEREDTNRG